jgi:hypothetical protein
MSWGGNLMADKYKIFFIMPFDPEFNDLYEHVKEMIENEDEIFEVFRADNLLNQQNILKDIVLAINNSDLIVADLTDLNANVFYELGLAHALRKDVILLTQQLDELPFDLRSYRVISYSTNFRKIEELDLNLKRMLSEIKKGQLSFGSPITDWLPENGETIDNSEKLSSQEKPAGFEIEIEEEGFLDFMENLEDAMTNLTEIVTNFSSTTEKMGVEITKQGQEIQTAAQNKGNGTASQIRKIARKTSGILNQYGLSIVKQNKEYDSNWTHFEENVNNLFNSQVIQREIKKNAGDFQEFVNVLGGFKDYIYPAKDSLEEMAMTLPDLKGIEGSMTKAVLLIERELNEFIDLLDKSIATTERLYIKGLDIIKNI